MITRDELRAIVAQHDEQETDYRIHEEACKERGIRAEPRYHTPNGHAHRGALLDLLCKVASYDPRIECEGRIICILCGAEGGCDSDCPAPVLEVLRGG